MANTGDPSLSPIHLDAPSKLVRIIANLAYACEAPRLDLSVLEYQILADVIDKLMAPEMMNSLFSAMEIDVAVKQPWAVFQLASQIQNIPLAQAAIRHFGGNTDQSPSIRLAQPSRGDMVGVRPDYYLALVRERLKFHSCPLANYQSGLGGKGSEPRC